MHTPSEIQLQSFDIPRPKGYISIFHNEFQYKYNKIEHTLAMLVYITLIFLFYIMNKLLTIILLSERFILIKTKRQEKKTKEFFYQNYFQFHFNFIQFLLLLLFFISLILFLYCFIDCVILCKIQHEDSIILIIHYIILK